MPRQASLTLLGAIMFVVIAACGGTATGGGAGGGTNGLTACESAMQRAAEIDPMQDTVTDLDPAIQQCESLDDFAAAADRFPDALDGTPASTFLGNRCAAQPAVDLEPVCVEVLGE